MRKYIRIMAAMTLALLCGQKGYAQTSVSGTVCDADGAPLPGVAVIVSSGEGKIGTSTDAKGVDRGLSDRDLPAACWSLSTAWRETCTLSMRRILRIYPCSRTLQRHLSTAPALLSA